MKTLAIIGGGAAGLASAVAAAQRIASCDASVRVIVYERADRVGKRILATGNGRCNYSNAHIEADIYRGAPFVSGAFDVLRPDETIAWLESLGLVGVEADEGRLYPLSNKASSVLDVLRLALGEARVEEVCGKHVVAVTPVENRFLVSCDDDSTVFADAVIIACGGTVARSIVPTGYTYRNTLPVLGPLETRTEPLKGLNNIRARCSITLLDGSSSAEKACERGEILFREYGVSGIAVFNLSRFAERGDRLAIDFAPFLGEARIVAELSKRIERFGTRSAVDLLAGFVLAPVARAICRQAEVAYDHPLDREKCVDLARACKRFDLVVEGIGDVRQCQVRSGGFSVDDFDATTLGSFRHPGLFMVGEALDVDAPCGGFNLHWAWTSGILAGRAAVDGIVHA